MKNIKKITNEILKEAKKYIEIAAPATDRKIVEKYLKEKKMKYDIGVSQKRPGNLFEIEVDDFKQINSIIKDLNKKRVRVWKVK